jgi:hypothetical protein
LTISVYKAHSTNSIPFSLVVKILNGTYGTEGIFTARFPGRSEVVNTAMTFNEDHAKMVAGFFRVFERAMGNSRDNKYLRHCFCTPLFNIYVLNQAMFSNDDLVERFGRCGQDNEIRMRLMEHSRDSVGHMRARILEVCNRGKKKKLSGGVCRETEEE